MSIDQRTYFYTPVMVNRNLELDYLSENMTNMELETVDTFRIPSVMQYRPDLIAYKFYKNFNLGWLLALHNDFLDPIYDFKTGTVIKIPSLDNYFRYYKAYTRS